MCFRAVVPRIIRFATMFSRYICNNNVQNKKFRRFVYVRAAGLFVCSSSSMRDGRVIAQQFARLAHKMAVKYSQNTQNRTKWTTNMDEAS